MYKIADLNVMAKLAEFNDAYKNYQEILRQMSGPESRMYKRTHLLLVGWLVEYVNENFKNNMSIQQQHMFSVMSETLKLARIDFYDLQRLIMNLLVKLIKQTLIIFQNKTN